MSVGKRVSESIDKMAAGDAEGALIPASIAVDATASQLFPTEKNNSAYKQFISDNLATITKFAFGGTSITQSLRVKYYHPDLIPDSDGLCSFEQIMYHVVRCGLLHAAELPSDLKFTNEGVIKVKDNSLILPASLIFGLIVAVVVSPTNAGESIGDSYTLNFRDNHQKLNELWGNKLELETLMADPNVA